MGPLDVLRLVAAALTIVAAILAATDCPPRNTVAGFAIFIAASTVWMIVGWMEDKPSLLIQNAVLLLVNIAGVYRWLPRA